MLKLLRKNTKVIIWIVVLSFGLWGVYSLSASLQKETRMAGEIFGKPVSYQEFNSFYKASQIFSFSGGEAGDAEAVKQKTWQSLLFSREAKHRKINVTDDEVRSEVRRLLAVQNIENPTPEAYRHWLESTIRETPVEFERQIRELLRIQKFVRQINAEFKETVTDEEAHQLFLLEAKTITAEAVEFPTLNEAQVFAEKTRNPKKYGDEIKQAEGTAKKIENTGLVALMQAWQMTETDALKVHATAKGAFSDPVAVGERTVFFKILDKQEADEKKFEAEKEAYRQKVVERKNYAKFLEWTLDLMGRANLKDFLPQAESQP